MILQELTHLKLPENLLENLISSVVQQHFHVAEMMQKNLIVLRKPQTL